MVQSKFFRAPKLSNVLQYTSVFFPKRVCHVKTCCCCNFLFPQFFNFYQHFTNPFLLIFCFVILALQPCPALALREKSPSLAVVSSCEAPYAAYMSPLVRIVERRAKVCITLEPRGVAPRPRSAHWIAPYGPRR